MSQNICNICGANYEYRGGRWKCPACGAVKPEELSNEEQTLLFVADQKRRLVDFMEAECAYTDIIEKYPQNPYGYWGRLLCKHGIKYEQDYNGKMIPTCCAPSIDSLKNDKDCQKAIQFADKDTRAYFTEQSEIIERIRTVWADKAKKEKPYDIFICYKDSDLAKGIERTQDSVEAQEIYVHLISQGYRVFFSRESLRDKIGEKYEPYIFNALSTAKIMLVYGKSAGYITSTWLKNEWSRYFKMMKDGLKKPNSLIVAYEGFSPSELPSVLSSMQCLDASRKTFYFDLDSEIQEVISRNRVGIIQNKENKLEKRTKKILSEVEKNVIKEKELKFKKSKFSKAILFFMVLFGILSMSMLVNNNYKLGFLYLTISGLFSVSYLFGRQILRWKNYNFHIIPAILAFLLMGTIGWGSNINTVDYNHELEWQTNGLFALLPEPEITNGKIVSETEKQIQFELYKCSPEDFNKYVQACRNKGFNEEVTKNDDVFYSKNAQGYDLDMFYDTDTKVLKVYLDSYNIENSSNN